MGLGYSWPMYSYDPELVGRALQKTGSSYTPAQSASAPAPAPNFQSAPAPVVQAKDTEVPAAPPPSSGGFGQSMGEVKGWADSASQAMQPGPEEKKPDGLQRLGQLVGTVMSVYTGNYMGAAQGISGMSGGGK